MSLAVDSGRHHPPSLSVVVPVHNGAATLGRCLTALAASDSQPLERIVVDDASTDGSAAIAEEAGARVLRRTARGGPAAARNTGAAAATGEVLLFLDADCEIHPDAVAAVGRAFAEDPQLDALFGSYDDDPAERDAVSRFKNLFHHWTHQRAAREASTFWAGCGAIRRPRFLALGGFDERRYPLPSIEDIELGCRLRRAGGTIRIVPSIQVRHLKRWALGELIRTDLWRRGVPWTELLVASRGACSGLNLAWRSRLEVAAGLAAVAALLAAPVRPAALWLAAAAALALVLSSAGFYRLLARRAGPATLVAALPLHLLYALICAAALVIGLCRAVAKPSPLVSRA